MIFLKYIILFSIFMFSTSIGILISKKSVNRVNELKEFKKAINIMKSKMKFTYEPLGEIFQDISKNIEGSISKVFKDTSDFLQKDNSKVSWNNSIEKNEQYLNLNKEDKNIILSLGNMLGKTDINGQISELELTDNFIEIQITKAEEIRKKDEKLYKTLGSIVGLAIIIIFV